MKAQTSGEFVLILGLIIVFVATVMVIGFRNSEINLALSATRLAANEYAIQNPNYVVTSIDYAVDEANRKVGVFPLFFFRNGSKMAAGGDNDSFVAIGVEKLRRTFHPNRTTVIVGNCFPASYYAYCVAPSGA